jgi:hypothetical protein
MDIIDQIAPVIHGVVPEVEVASEVVPVPEPKLLSISQDRFDAIVKERQGSALKRAAAAEAEVARLKAITVGSAEDASIVEKLRAEIALETQRASAAEARSTAQEKELLLSQLGTAIDAVSPHDVSKLLADEIVRRDNRWVVVDTAGVEQLNPDSTPVTPQQHYEAWAASHLYAIHGRTKSGSGSTPSSGRLPPVTLPLSHYWGPGSSAKDCNQLAISRPDQYKIMRAEAVRLGLAPGTN